MPTYDTKIDELLNINVRMNQLIQEFRGPSELLRREMAKMLVDPLQDLIRQRNIIDAEMRNMQSAFPQGMTLDPGLVRTDSRMLVRLPMPKDDLYRLREEVADLRALIERPEQPDQQR